MHRKFLFFDFAARKRNIFSRPEAVKTDLHKAHKTQDKSRLFHMVQNDFLKSYDQMEYKVSSGTYSTYLVVIAGTDHDVVGIGHKC